MTAGILATFCVLSVIGTTALLAARPPRHKTPTFILVFSAVFFGLSAVLGLAFGMIASIDPMMSDLIAGALIGASFGTLIYQFLFLAPTPKSKD